MTTQKSLQKEQAAFLKAAGNTVREQPLHEVPRKEIDLAMDLIYEEIGELEIAVRVYKALPQMEPAAELLKELVDSVYVLMQLANTLGLPFDAGWNEVHRSNMEKVTPKVIRREDGKILKPPGWKKPDMEAVILRSLAENRLP